MKLLPYHPASASGKTLASALGIKRLRVKNSKAVIHDDTPIINWGFRGNHIAFSSNKVLNKRNAVVTASDKLKCFEILAEHGVPVPKHTTNTEEAGALFDLHKLVVSRETLTGHSGQGIEILTLQDFVEYDVGKSQLFVEYIPKKFEYRYHVAGGKVIDKRRKARDRDVEDENVNWKVRNTAGGFIFAIDEEHEYPEGAEEVAIESVKACGLDFGAVDIIYNTQRGLFVLEINTAPGLEGRTTERYAEAIKEMI